MYRDVCVSAAVCVSCVFSLALFSSCLFCLILICLFLFHTIVLRDAHLLMRERKKGCRLEWMVRSGRSERGNCNQTIFYEKKSIFQ